MKVLVTGGCGYLGSVLVPLMLKYDLFDLVRVLDKRTISRCNHPKLEFVEGDIRNRGLVLSALEGIDSVVHLAAIRQSHCMDNGDEAWEVNYSAAGWLALLADNCKQFIFASTCSVYGRQDALADEDTVLAPTSTYARTKESAEESVIKMHPNALIFRFATMFGASPNMRSDLIVNRLVRDAVVGNVLSVYDPDARRALVHVEDAARAVIHFLLRRPKPHGNVFNIGSLNAAKSEIVNRIRNKVPNVRVEIELTDDPRSYEVSFGRMAGAAFFPVRTLDSGISELIQEFRKRYKGGGGISDEYNNRKGS